MCFKAIDKEISARMTGISLNNMNAGERQKAFEDWAGSYCEFYSSFEEAENHLPFKVKIPDFSVLHALSGIYIIKRQENLTDTVLCHFENGINGITLTITCNYSEIDHHFNIIQERDGNNPPMIRWLDSDLLYILYGGWEDCYSKEDLEKIYRSLYEN